MAPSKRIVGERNTLDIKLDVDVKIKVFVTGDVRG